MIYTFSFQKFTEGNGWKLSDYTTKLDEIPIESLDDTANTRILVQNNKTKTEFFILSRKQYIDFLEGLVEAEERAAVWRKAPLPVNKIEKAVNPSHYKNYIDELQWIEAMQKIPAFSNPDTFCSALELQVRKYLDRNGKKDAELQELKKALWYLKLLVSIKTVNRTVLVKEVEDILNGKIPV